MQKTQNDLDYLAGRLHGRRSSMAEGERLDALCNIRSIPELAQAIYPESECQNAVALQSHLIEELIREISEISTSLSKAGAGLLSWTLVRFQVENLKVLLRMCWTQHSPQVLQEHLVKLPAPLELDTGALAGAGSLAEFATQMPRGRLKDNLIEAIDWYGAEMRPFFAEAALDRGYFQELIERSDKVSDEEEIVKPVLVQEVDIFHLMLATRGRFQYQVSPELLLPLHVAGTAVSRKRFAVMVAAVDLRQVALQSIGRVIDRPPRGFDLVEGSREFDLPTLEKLAWARLLSLAHRAFRRSQMGLGIVLGYAGIRRIEVANLITISEGIRQGMIAETFRNRLVPKPHSEFAYV